MRETIVGKRSMRILSLIVSLILTSGMFFVVETYAVDYDLIVYVNGSMGSDGNTGLDGSDPFETIGKGINYLETHNSGNGLIYISQGTYEENITISTPMTLVGENPENTIIDGQSLDRVITISESVDVSLEHIKIINGKAEDGADGSSGSVDGEDGKEGGGIYSKGDLEITDCILLSNQAGHGGSGIVEGYDQGHAGNGGHGGAVYCIGTLLIKDSQVGNNAAGDGGSGESARYSGKPAGDGGHGGGVYCLSTVTIENSRIYQNQAGNGHDGSGSAYTSTEGGAGGYGGGVYTDANVISSHSSIYNNSAGNGGNGGNTSTGTAGLGGLGGPGGGIYCKGNADLSSTEFYGNQAGNGGSGGNHRIAPKKGGDGGSGGGVFVEGAISANGNRFAGNIAGIGGTGGLATDEPDNNAESGVNGAYSQVDGASGLADNNWWGSNLAPISTMTNIPLTKWLILSIRSDVATLGQGLSTNIYIDMTHNNLGEQVDTVFTGAMVSLTANLGTLDSHSFDLILGQGDTIYTGNSCGSETIVATVDGVQVELDLEITKIGIVEDSITFIAGTQGEQTLSAFNAQGDVSWTANSLPAGLDIDEATGIISGLVNETGNFNVQIEVTDERTDGILTATKEITIKVILANGNGAYLITPDINNDYTSHINNEGLTVITIDHNFNGYLNILADIKAVKGHAGLETALLVHMRNGSQKDMAIVTSDFEIADQIGAGFNVRGGDTIQIYIVDGINSSGDVNPNIL